MDGLLKRTATFEWSASTRSFENGKPAAATELKTGERATVNYTHHGRKRVAVRIAIWLTRLRLAKPRGTLDTVAH